MSRLVLMVGMGDLLCETHFINTCRTLFLFMKKYNLKNLVKIRKSASKIVMKILQLVEITEVPELERLSQGEASRWAASVQSSFRCCMTDEILLIEFLLYLLSDEQLSSCQSIIVNRYGSTKLVRKGCVLSSVLSMLLSLVNGFHDKLALTTKFCQWLVESIERADDDQCHILFNAFDALTIILQNDAALKEVKIGMSLANAMNALPLPERSRIFAARYLVMIQSYNSELCNVDINRFVISASDPETLGLAYLLTEAKIEIPGSLWDKAATLLSTSRTNDPKLRAFVTNQLIIGIQARSPCCSTRFKFMLDKLSCAQPDEDFLLMFCNQFLFRIPGYFPQYVDQLIPLWIFSVLALSSSREMETKRFTSLIWSHISHLLSNIVSNISMELSLGDVEFNVVKFYMVLGSSKSSADIVKKIVADSVPLYTANQIAILLKKDDKVLQERILRVCGEILTHVGHIMLTIAEAEAQRTGLNRTSFVVLIQALVAKLVKGSVDPSFLLHIVPVYVSALVRLPYRIFIYSRVKDILIKFVDEPTIALSISDKLADLNALAYHSQLANESDPRIKRFLKASGSM